MYIVNLSFRMPLTLLIFTTGPNQPRALHSHALQVISKMSAVTGKQRLGKEELRANISTAVGAVNGRWPQSFRRYTTSFMSSSTVPILLHEDVVQDKNEGTNP